MIELIPADWPAPLNVRAFVSTRRYGASKPPYANGNLALHVGEDASVVRQNRKQFSAALPGCDAVQWLEQVHGTVVHRIKTAGNSLRGDGLVSDVAGLACAVLTADCLPVFLTNTAGSEVGVVHAGWRGLAAGILANAVDKFSATPNEMLAWFGPAISQAHFEVGAAVADRLLASIDAALTPAETVVRPGRGDPGNVMVDLFEVARQQLQIMGVAAVHGGNFCAYADTERFYSYRRTAITGRMASVIYMA